MAGRSFNERPLQRPTTRDELDQDDDHRDHEQNVYVGTDGAAADQADSPENEQDNCNGPQHMGNDYRVGIFKALATQRTVVDVARREGFSCNRRSFAKRA